MRLSVVFHGVSSEMLHITLPRPWFSGLFSWLPCFFGPSSARNPPPIPSQFCNSPNLSRSQTPSYKKSFLSSLPGPLQLPSSSELVAHCLPFVFTVHRTWGYRSVKFKKLKTWVCQTNVEWTGVSDVCYSFTRGRADRKGGSEENSVDRGLCSGSGKASEVRFLSYRQNSLMSHGAGKLEPSKWSLLVLETHKLTCNLWESAPSSLVNRKKNQSVSYRELNKL